MRTIKKQARLAGVLYLILGIAAPIGLMFAPNAIYVAGNPTLTADHIRASESFLRLGIASELFHQTVQVFLAVALYRLFRAVNGYLAALTVILGALLSIPIVFLNVVSEFAAIMLATGTTVWTAFTRSQLDALAYLFIRLHGQGIDVASIFWGLWLFPFGLLVIRSRFIPRVLGWLMMVAGVGYVATAVAWVLFPHYLHAVGQAAMILEFGEVPIILWLVIWGARGPLAHQPLAAAPAASLGE